MSEDPRGSVWLTGQRLRVLVTGCAGFIGSHFVEHLLKESTWDVIGLDRIDPTSALARIGKTDAYRHSPHRFRFVWHDLKAPINASLAHEIGPVDYIFHLAASTHVDRSITDPMTFVQDNVIGTVHVLEYVRHLAQWDYHMAPAVLVFSTDEVFGPAAPGQAFEEWDRFCSSNPYAASKAAAEEFVTAYRNTYRLKTIVTHCTNVFGERQHQEKYLPLLVKKILLGEEIKVHADPTRTVPSSRFYIHARNVAAALLHITYHCTRHPHFGEKWNIGSQDEIDSLRLAQLVGEDLGKPVNATLVDAVANRPGHDMRYGLDCSRLFDDLGFTMPVDFRESLRRTVAWYNTNRGWLGL